MAWAPPVCSRKCHERTRNNFKKAEWQNTFQTYHTLATGRVRVMQLRHALKRANGEFPYVLRKVAGQVSYEVAGAL